MFDLTNKNIYVGDREIVKGYLGEQVLYRTYSEPTLPEAVTPTNNMFAYDFTSGEIVKYANADSTFGGTGPSLSEEFENFAEGGFIVRSGHRHNNVLVSKVFTFSVTIRNNFALEGQTINRIFRYNPQRYTSPMGFYMGCNYDPNTKQTEYTLNVDQHGAGKHKYILPPVDTDHIEVTIVTTSGDYVDVYINGEFWRNIYGGYAVNSTGNGSYFDIGYEYKDNPFILYDYKFYRVSLSKADIVSNYNNVRQRLQNI